MRQEEDAGASRAAGSRHPVLPAGSSCDPNPEGLSYGLLPRPCRALVLLNPLSGPGLALKDFHALVQPMLAEADIAATVFVTAINYYAGNEQVSKHELLINCAFILCKGLHTQMDLVSLSTASGKRLFSFLSFGWGFISDVDIASEKYRKLGNARFTLGTLQQLARPQLYRGRPSYPNTLLLLL
ncbi:PREDICTED: sphingosine kinase 1 [Tinamus guttatus]|uniref:sphingosine kinase 1 n=1 Tax=Tinamus guttatus TaxID=94827 RepID=UPI00052F0605|nr:PREDICTED: sphingosine kinase 1 [Tinamus guttatus]